MKMKHLFIIAIALSIFLYSCNTDMPNISIRKGELSSINAIDIDLSVNDELYMIDIRESNTTRSIKLRGQVGSIISTQFADAVGSHIPMFLLLKTPEGTFGAKIQGTILDEKKLKVKSNISNKFKISNKTSSNYKAKLYIGGEYNDTNKSLQFNTQSPLEPIVVSSSTNLDFKEYTGKIPFASDWVELKLGDAGDLTLTDTLQSVKIKPKGAIYTFYFDLPNTLLNSMECRHNDFISQGEILLDKDEHYWQALNNNIGHYYTYTKDYQNTVLSGSTGSGESSTHYFYWWGDQVNLEHSYNREMTIVLRFYDLSIDFNLREVTRKQEFNTKMPQGIVIDNGGINRTPI